MCPRIDVFALESNKKILDVIDDLIAKGFSRVPVYKENLDKIIGVLYVKDLLPHLENDNFNWTSLLRKPLYIPENKKLDDLLNEFQQLKIHLAIVVDEYGGNSGIITMEDIVEEIVGGLSDKFYQEDLSYYKIDSNNYIFDGKVTIKDFCKVLEDTKEEKFEEYKGESETIAGFILEISGKFPKIGEKINFKSYKISRLCCNIVMINCTFFCIRDYYSLLVS